MRNPPTLLSLTIDSAIANFSHIYDLSFLPEHILLELFVVCVVYFNHKKRKKKKRKEKERNSCWASLDLRDRTLKAGKLNERILKLFLATGKEELLSIIQALNIQHVMLPVLPTRCSGKF